MLLCNHNSDSELLFLPFPRTTGLDLINNDTFKNITTRHPTSHVVQSSDMASKLLSIALARHNIQVRDFANSRANRGEQITRIL